MASRIDLPGLAFAAFLVGVGAFAFVLAGELATGRAASMGPGYVPRGLALLVMVYGAALGIAALAGPGRPFPAVAWRPLVLIGGGVSLFAVMLPTAGLALTGFAVVLCAGYAATDTRHRENALLALALAAFAALLFVKGLGLPIALWPRL